MKKRLTKRQLTEAKRKAKSKLKRKYRLTMVAYETLVAKQGHKCPVCGKPFKRWKFSPYIKRDTCVDHCHETGTVRGILHNHCNQAIGFLQDNPNHCANASSYLVNT